MIDWVDSALQDWARWSNDDTTGLGWQPISVVGRCMDQGAQGASSSRRPSLFCDLSVEKVEKAVLTLERRELKAVKHYYLAGRSEIMTAGLLGLKGRNYRELMDGVHVKVAQELKACPKVFEQVANL